jgi:hypothetical protein
MPDGSRSAVLDGKSVKVTQPAIESILEESAPCLLRLDNIDETVWEVSVDLL